MSEVKKSNERLEELARELRRQCLAHDPDRLHTMTLTEIYDNIFCTNPAIVEDLLFPGMYLLAGDSKIGKSFLVSQIAFHVATGKDFWERHVQQGEVLYLALEDHYARIQSRMYKMFRDEDTDLLHFAISAKLLGDGLEDQLRSFIEKHQATRLIIIDTLQKVRGNASDTYSYSKDYEVISKLKAFADHYGICMLLVHHTRKLQSDDPFGKINGTTGLMGAADGVMLLSKESRTSNSATVEISGRDQPDTKIKIEKDPKTLLWDLVSFENELWVQEPDPLLPLLAGKLQENGGVWSGTATELNSFLGTDMKPNALSLKLNVNASVLLHDFRIVFRRDRTGACRQIELRCIPDDSMTINDGHDDHIVHEKTPSSSSFIVTETSAV